LKYPHEPVLVEEVMADLLTGTDGIYVDGTCGSGGHSRVIGESLSEAGRLICLDRDPHAVLQCRERTSFLGSRATVTQANYSSIDEVLENMRVDKVTGVLLDLGISTYQLDHSGRGFSFNRDEPLDMRMDLIGNKPARYLVNRLPAKELERILRDYGEEKKAKLISRAIVRKRQKKEITSSLQLAQIIRSVMPRARKPGAKDPATRSFQAFRIAVNRELENLRRFLDIIPDWIHKGGRLVIISYHSLEDRIVKQAIRVWEKGCICPPDFPVCACGKVPLFKALRREGIKPTEQEIARNPRARSAVLRGAERI
jgi:16S rRNA (cytosine1402-N4)-methyltransferase